MLNLRGRSDFWLQNDGNELKLITMDAESNFEAIERKQNIKKLKDSQKDREPFFRSYGHFLTSDTLNNYSCIIMYADYSLINNYTSIIMKETSQFSKDRERVFWRPLFNAKIMTSWWWVILMTHIFWNFKPTSIKNRKEKELWWKFLWEIHVLKISDFFWENSDMAIVSLKLLYM